MPLPQFHLYTFIGSWPWCFGLAYVGMVLGDQWNNSPWMKAAFHSADLVIGVVIVVTVAWYVRHKLKGLKHHP